MNTEYTGRHFPVRQGDQNLALGIIRQVTQIELATALPGPPLAQRQQPGQAAIGGPVTGVTEETRAIPQVQPRPHQQPHIMALGGHMGAHDARQAVAVGKADGSQAQRPGGRHQLVRVAGTAKEGKVAYDL